MPFLYVSNFSYCLVKDALNPCIITDYLKKTKENLLKLYKS